MATRWSQTEARLTGLPSARDCRRTVRAPALPAPSPGEVRKGTEPPLRGSSSVQEPLERGRDVGEIREDQVGPAGGKLVDRMLSRGDGDGHRAAGPCAVD